MIPAFVGGLVLGFLAGLFVCGMHWMARVRQEIENAEPAVARVLRRLLRWPA